MRLRPAAYRGLWEIEVDILWKRGGIAEGRLFLRNGLCNGEEILSTSASFAGLHIVIH